MQYETIILELLSRIKKLEEEVGELKQVILTTTNDNYNDDTDISEKQNESNKNSVSYTKITEEMIDFCYRNGKKLVAGENIMKLAYDITDSTGMNQTSAIMCLYAVQGMLEGKVYKRAISTKATKKFYDAIWKDCGNDGLQKAIYATRLHIDYRKECNLTSNSIEKICELYEKKLENL